VTIRKAYFRKYNMGAFRKILGWGETPEDALIMALEKARNQGLMRKGYKCVGGEEVTLNVFS